MNAVYHDNRNHDLMLQQESYLMDRIQVLLQERDRLRREVAALESIIVAAFDSTQQERAS